MANIKLIATDMDGTFLDDPSTPNEQNLAMLRRCREAGIEVCVCSGRNLHGLRFVLEAGPFSRYCVINNGAAIYDTKTESLRYRNRFDPQTATAIFEIGASYEDAHLGASTTHFTHLLRSRAHAGMLERWEARAQADPHEARGLVVHETVEALVEGCKDDLQRINLGVNINDPGQLTEVYERMSEVHGVEITSSGHSNMEITPKQASKAEALSVLADIYEVQPEEVMALGDSFNDIHMLLWAGVGVAMGNADQRIKSIADYITDTNVNGGVAQAIERIVFA